MFAGGMLRRAEAADRRTSEWAEGGCGRRAEAAASLSLGRLGILPNGGLRVKLQGAGFSMGVPTVASIRPTPGCPGPRSPPPGIRPPGIRPPGPRSPGAPRSRYVHSRAGRPAAAAPCRGLVRRVDGARGSSPGARGSGGPGVRGRRSRGLRWLRPRRPAVEPASAEVSSSLSRPSAL